MSGAEGLLSIGAIEFLSHLRQDADPDLYQSIDNVIHQLLSLPQANARDHDERCLYKVQNPLENIQTSMSHNGYEQSSGRCSQYWVLKLILTHQSKLCTVQKNSIDPF